MSSTKDTKIDIVKCSRRLRDLRIKSGLSHAALGSAVGISEQSLKNYEQAVLKDGKADLTSARVNAIAGMSIDSLYRLARFFGVNSDYLLGLSDDPSPDITLKEMANTTGMTSAAIRRVMSMHDPNNPLCLDADKTKHMFNALLENGYMDMLVTALCDLLMVVDEVKPVTESEPQNMDEFSKLIAAEKKLKYARFDFSEEANRIADHLLNYETVLRQIERIKHEWIKEHFGVEVE